MRNWVREESFEEKLGENVQEFPKFRKSKKFF